MVFWIYFVKFSISFGLFLCQGAPSLGVFGGVDVRKIFKTTETTEGHRETALRAFLYTEEWYCVSVTSVVLKIFIKSRSSESGVPRFNRR
jgi:hypothetical protein